MKRIFSSLLVLLISLYSQEGFSQSIPCPLNIDWEMGDTTGWTAQYGQYNPPADGVSTGTSQTVFATPHQNFTPRRHEIMNTGMPADPYGGFPVVSPLGGGYAIKIGSDTNGFADEYRVSRIQYVLTVPQNDNYGINFLYAVVLNNPPHPANQQPRFTVSVLDAATGQSVKDGCYDLNFVADASLPGFFVSPIPAAGNGSDVLCKDWTKHTLRLRGLAGKTIILDVAVGGCSASAHWAYGYFDVLDCGEYKIKLDSCNLNRQGAYLKAPEGFMTYEWYNSDYSVLMDTGLHAAFQPLTTTPQIYKLIVTPFPSISLCKDTFETMPLANIDITKIDTTCVIQGDAVVLDGKITGGSGPLTYNWTEVNASSTLSCTSCPVTTATTPHSNFYIVTATDTNFCHRSEIMSVGINENSLDAIDDFVFCHPGYTSLNVEPDGPNPLTKVECGTNLNGCTSAAPVIVQSAYRERLKGRFDTSSTNNPFATQYSSGRMQFLLKKDDLYRSGFRYGTLNSIGFQVMLDENTPTLDNLTISLGCTNVPSMGGSFQPGTKLVYTAPVPVTLNNGWNDFAFDSSYNWDTASNILVDICYTVAVPNDTEFTSVLTVNTNGLDGHGEYTKTLGSSICQGSAPEVSSFYVGRPVTRLGFCKSADRPFEYTWTPGLYLSDSTAKSPLAYIAKTTKYYVTSVGGSDCKIKDSVTVTVPIHDYDIYPKDTSVCYQEAFQLNALGTFSSVKWYEYDRDTKTFTVPNSLSCADCPDANKDPNPIAVPKVSGDTLSYAVEFTDKDGCNDTLYMNVEVRPLPPVKIVNNDTTIKYGNQIMLLAQGGYMYSWMPTDELSNPNVVNPVAAPTEPTMYYVYGLGENGCRAIDSVYVNIDFSANLFVPTAFTPNGDGKNDVFRISNITFQRLQEFRVFNRWGKEVFSTNDIKDGWDGSYKGQPQDMGVYQYIIKVASADGEIYTYKGDVTLVR